MARWEHGGGFSVDGLVRIETDDRAGRERLLRYCARPPFALERLRELGPERLLYESHKPAPGGNGPLRLTPLQLLDRLAALVHRHRYFAVLAPNSSLRALVTAGRAGGDARLGRAAVERLLSRFSTAASVGSSCRQWVELRPSITVLRG
jgi:hypothetical protein